ncbi:hypothetical protein HMPREF1576_00460 [Gardnerella pickettii JCP7719]|uniref:Uncharacterized protein n=1 Tax=Gardnerella pickettii JCP7719 TaxID=1261061 RepID=S4GNE7_9BIFI|nr:hypothetical protein HMPREF1576_00460 [Gardnerella pickettii JCP7719]
MWSPTRSIAKQKASSAKCRHFLSSIRFWRQGFYPPLNIGIVNRRKR